RRARRRALPVLEPVEPGEAAAGRERVVEPGCAQRVGAAAARGGRGAERVRGARRELHAAGHRGRGVLLPALPIRAGGAPSSVVARPPQGAALHGGRLEEDGHLRRHGEAAESDGCKKMATFCDMAIEQKVTVYDKGFEQKFESYGEYVTRSGDIWSPRISNE